jgi:pSer/pThr/pTyr-binding forkhead associated (FHA) protein
MHPWSDPKLVAGSRAVSFRVRFGNEEIALAMGPTLIGRDATCKVTLRDGVVSRRHARIQCSLNQAIIEDLGSRNGTLVNGVLISGPHVLKDGDRITVGSHELTLVVTDPESGEFETDTPTGLMLICKHCRGPLPEDGGACTRCGSTRTAEHRTPVRNIEDTTQERWSLGLLIEMLGKAILTERSVDAEWIMREASNLIHDRISSFKPIDRDELLALRDAAIWVDQRNKGTSWVLWVDRILGPQRPTTVPGAPDDQ